MKIKRYVTESFQEALAKINAELGKDAVILYSRNIKRGGIMGLFSKPKLEVIAALEEKVNFPEKDRIEKLERELDGLKNYVRTMENGNTQKKYKNEFVEKYKNIFIEQELHPEITESLLEDFYDFAASAEIIEAEIKKRLYRIIGDPVTINVSSGKKPCTVIFIGPTGVGKTTTLAKIAADLALNKGYKIALITADTYRIAAVEQLKVYADILSIDLEVIYNPLEIVKAIKKFSDKDFILIDTAGRSHKNQRHMLDLVKMFNSYNFDEVFLLLSANMRVKDIDEISRAYNFLPDYKLIITKLDETSVLGTIVNARYITKKPLSYVTFGQNVPEDIEIANTSKIVEILLERSDCYGPSGKA